MLTARSSKRDVVPASTPAPTTTCPSRSTSTSSSRGYARFMRRTTPERSRHAAGRRRRPRREQPRGPQGRARRSASRRGSTRCSSTCCATRASCRTGSPSWSRCGASPTTFSSRRRSTSTSRTCGASSARPHHHGARQGLPHPRLTPVFRRLRIKLALQFTALVFVLMLVLGAVFIAIEFTDVNRQLDAPSAASGGRDQQAAPAADHRRAGALAPPGGVQRQARHDARGEVLYASDIFARFPSVSTLRRLTTVRADGSSYRVLTTRPTGRPRRRRCSSPARTASGRRSYPARSRSSSSPRCSCRRSRRCSACGSPAAASPRRSGCSSASRSSPTTRATSCARRWRWSTRSSTWRCAPATTSSTSPPPRTSSRPERSARSTTCSGSPQLDAATLDGTPVDLSALVEREVGAPRSPRAQPQGVRLNTAHRAGGRRAG